MAGIDGLWILEYEGAERGAGVVVFANGRVLGGDDAYLYEGHYAIKGDWFASSVHVSNYVPGVPNALGYVGDLSTELTAPVHESLMLGTVTVVGHPGAQVKVRFTKKADL